MHLAYYAHPMSIYNTAQETRDLEIIKALGFEVLNPNGPEHDAGYKAKGMDYFDECTKDCTIIVFRAFPDGSIPAGVAKEIEFFRKRNLPVIELPVAVARRSLSVEATREALKECGFR